MLQEQIYSQAIETIKARRRAAQEQQDARTDQIRREIPETAELDRQLRSACMEIARTMGSAQCAQQLRAIEQHTREADAMLRSLLTAHGYPADYLDVHYTCTLCNDTGFTGGKPCICLEREIGRIGTEQMNLRSQLALSSFDTFSMQYYKGLPADQFQAMEQNFQICKSSASAFSPSESGNLLMIGNTGLGKTHLSLAIANAVLQRGFSVLYDSVGSLLHTLEQEQFRKAANAQGDTLSVALDADLLILDDFGTEFDTAFSRAMISTLLNCRINAGKPMIINTNLTHNDIQERYGDRILSRLLFASRILHFYGRDIRIQKRVRKSGSQEAKT